MMSANDFNSKQILLLITKEGQKLSFKNENVIITDSNNKIIHQSTCYRLFAIFIVGHITITSGLIQRAKKFGFSIAFLTSSFRLYQLISSTAEANVLLRQKQYQYENLGAAKILISNKIDNQRRLLMQYRDKDDDYKIAISNIDLAREKLNDATSIQSIMGIEGSVSRIYFRLYFNNVIWHGRKPRIKNDMVNTLLDIGYTILFSFLDCVLAVYGFDRYCGILHRQFYMRKSLVCDIIEPFRIIIDKQVKKSINLGQFKEKDFNVYDGRWCLKYEKSSEYSAIFLKAILEYKEEMFLYVREFYRVMLKGDIDEKMPYCNLEV